MKMMKKKHNDEREKKMLIYEETWNIWLDADNGFFIMFWMLANRWPYSVVASPFVVKCDKHPCCVCAFLDIILMPHSNKINWKKLGKWIWSTNVNN